MAGPPSGARAPEQPSTPAASGTADNKSLNVREIMSFCAAMLREKHWAVKP